MIPNAIPTDVARADGGRTIASARPRVTWLQLLAAAVVIVGVGLLLVLLPSRFDWLNVVPAIAAAFAALSWMALPVISRGSRFWARAFHPAAGERSPRWRFLVAPFARMLVFLPLLFLAAEFGLRCGSYHRSVYYERVGDLLFTPIPNQEYVEKISLSWSRIDELGLRAGPPVSNPESRRVVLCLGDSITYGYGLDDAHTYPALLQERLEARAPGKFLVLNGGVNAYPISFEHQKFLYLWNRGVRPDIVLVGYSMNEGWLGHLVNASPEAKNRFEWQVKAKNLARRSAVYNLIVENWARHYYDAIKPLLIPGTNSLSLSAADQDRRYEESLDALLATLTERRTRPIFMTFATFNGLTGAFDTTGPLQQRFTAFAEAHHLPLLKTDEILAAAKSPDGTSPFFLDHGHMSPAGTARIADALAARLTEE